jgi:phosphoribosyl 1,2-cyclic phosphodiesterase
MPCSGKNFLRYGGNTTCFSMDTPQGVLIVDAGTGIASVAKDIASSEACKPITILFTHFHMDHVIGLPVFGPLYRPGAEVTLMADPRRDHDWKASLRHFISHPYWPVGLGDGDATMKLEDLPAQEGRMSRLGVDVTWFSVPHPQGCLAYRLSFEDKSVVVATDTEYSAGNIDPAFIAFCEGAGALIFDSQFTPAEAAAHLGWGHSTWEAATVIAEKAGVGQLVLTHHDPDRSDRSLDSIVREAKTRFRNTAAAFEGMALRQGGAPAPIPRSTTRTSTHGRGS